LNASLRDPRLLEREPLLLDESPRFSAFRFLRAFVLACTAASMSRFTPFSRAISDFRRFFEYVD
jgi:hypothetical protein